ncbi:MAG: rhomboid family intramembrane serine protease [Flavobacterium sp.]|nr:rhomboid family intramembrane serine protease [Flavobacterium sp.]
MMPITPTVKQLLIVNFLFFVGSQLLGDVAYQYLSLYDIENDSFRFWQPLTHMFMHAEVYNGNFSNIMHIAFNMFALYSFGSILEHYWGGIKFLFFYISCGLGAALLHSLVNYVHIQLLLDQLSQLSLSASDLHLLLNADYTSVFDENGQMVASQVSKIMEKAQFQQADFNTLIKAVQLCQTPAVGASGAIYGLLVAFAFMAPNAELGLMFIPIPIKAKYFVPGLLAVDLYMGVRGESIFGGASGIAHFAHIGGALVGFLMVLYWKKNQFKSNRWN